VRRSVLALAAGIHGLVSAQVGLAHIRCGPAPHAFDFSTYWRYETDAPAGFVK
jgi:hypothetical protein